MRTSMSVTETLGRYRIGERIGTGGTADVFRAEVEGAAGFAKTLVIKRLRPHVADEPALVEGLAREAKLAQRLHHGNIVQVLDFGVQDGQPYVVMEHVDGCSLHELQRDLQRRGERLGLPEALFVIEELCAALRYVHGLTDDDGVPLRLVHRDIKPRNVLVSREGVVKLTDFGIAKIAHEHDHTLPGVIKGTPAYLAPEQARGGEVDARTDGHALGLVLRELVGHQPAGHEPATGAAPPDARVDDELRRLCERATAEAPEERFQSAQALLRALQRWRASRELETSPGRLPAWVRRVRRQAQVAVPVSLDAALLRGGERAATVASGATPSEPGGRPGRGLALAVVVAVGLAGGAWTMLADRADMTETVPSQLPTTPAPSGSAAPDPVAPTPPIQPTPTPDRAIVPDPTPAPEPSPPGTDREPTREPSTKPIQEPGRLQVNVLPWAEVTVDGRALGRVPIDVELPPGRHRVRLSNPQLSDQTFTFELRAGGLHKISRW